MSEQVPSHIMDALEEDLDQFEGRVPDTVLDSLAEDLDRPHRRLTIVGIGHDQAHEVPDATQWESGAQFSFPSRPSEFQSQSEGQSPEVVDMTIGDSDGEQQNQRDANNAPHFEQWVGGTPSTHVDVVEGPVRPENVLDENIHARANVHNEHAVPVQNGFDDVGLSNTESVVSEAGPLDPVAETPEPEVVANLSRDIVLRMALVTLDEVDPCAVFRQRAAVMKSIPHIVRGPFRNALKLALEETTWGNLKTMK